MRFHEKLINFMNFMFFWWISWKSEDFCTGRWVWWWPWCTRTVYTPITPGTHHPATAVPGSHAEQCSSGLNGSQRFTRLLCVTTRWPSDPLVLFFCLINPDLPKLEVFMSQNNRLFDQKNPYAGTRYLRIHEISQNSWNFSVLDIKNIKILSFGHKKH